MFSTGAFLAAVAIVMVAQVAPTTARIADSSADVQDPARVLPSNDDQDSGDLAILQKQTGVADSCKCQWSGFTAPPGGCNSPECSMYDVTSQASCFQVTNEPATSDARWKAGLNVNVDQAILGGRIAAFQLQWFNGSPSGWYVPGVNDLDTKLNGCAMRRMWSYFYDHTHSYIICK